MLNDSVPGSSKIFLKLLIILLFHSLFLLIGSKRLLASLPEILAGFKL
jgi:hypothetical protein